MTLSAREKQARLEAPEPEGSLAGSLAFAFEELLGSREKVNWAQWRKDPCGFCETILGLECLPWQRRILEALTPGRAKRQVSAVSGNKVGKSVIDGAAALWWYSVFPGARVYITGPSAQHAEDVVWHEILNLLERSGTCLSCREAAEALDKENPVYQRPCPHSAIIEAKVSADCTDGLRSSDRRSISVVNPDKPEAMQGRAGNWIFVIVDEASGAAERLFSAIVSNMAGINARSLYTGNPMSTSGTFYDSHNSKAHLYETIQISSLEAIPYSAKYPALASQKWVDDMAALYGTEHAEYQIRVLGKYAPLGSHTVIPRYLVNDAQTLWEATEGTGPLQLGVDVAEYGDDNTVITPRRGKKLYPCREFNGLSSEEVVEQILLAAVELRNSTREIVTVVLDNAGVGIPVFHGLNVAKDRYLKVVGVHPGATPPLAEEYRYMRDQLWFAMRLWLKEGGTLPPGDYKLEEELSAPEYSFDVARRKVVERKDLTRKKIKRSPDRADSACLACWPVNANDSQAKASPLSRDPYPRPMGDNGYLARNQIYGGRNAPDPYGRR